MNLAIGDAIIALAISVLTLFLPLEFAGYVAWDDPHLALRTISAISVRIAVFAMAGAALRGGRYHKRYSDRYRLEFRTE